MDTKTLMDYKVYFNRYEDRSEFFLEVSGGYPRGQRGKKFAIGVEIDLEKEILLLVDEWKTIDRREEDARLMEEEKAEKAYRRSLMPKGGGYA